MNQIVERPCGFRGCKTHTKVEVTDLENHGFYHVRWCKPCEKRYIAEKKEWTKLVPKWNKKQLVHPMSIKNKPMVFGDGVDLSNYMFRFKRREFNKIQKVIQTKVDKKLS